VGSILAAVDFSAVSDRVIEDAARLAAAFELPLTLVHVAAPDPEFVGYDAGPDTVRDSRAAELRDEHRRLQDAAAGCRQRGIDCHAVLIQGPTVEELLEAAERTSAEVIVVGSRGHGAVRRALVGSVSEGVIHGATCPVWLVPHST
jgi:nucleotide-binding universal stress UspA family protein